MVPRVIFSTALLLGQLVFFLGQPVDATRDRPPILTDTEYDRLMEILLMPLKERATTKGDDRLYRKAKKHHMECKEISDPYRGQVMKRLTKNGLILLPAQEIDDCILYFHRQSLGDGSQKIWHLIKDNYFGISREKIKRVLAKYEIHSKFTPTFKNKAPLQPMQVFQVMECHQVDLVDLVLFHQDNIIPERYVLTILDCFSHFLWLRAVPDKQASTISDKLAEIYMEWGPPQILQCDQGNELKDAVSELDGRFSIKCQCRVERYRALWKNKVRTLISDALQEGILAHHSWQHALQIIAKNYNIGYHSSIKMSPYECLFGVESNFIKQGLEGGKVEEMSCDEEMLAPVAEAFRQKRMLELGIRRSQAAESNAKEENAMTDAHEKKSKPAIYADWEEVDVKDVNKFTSLTREEERGWPDQVEKGSKYTLEKLANMISQETLGMDMLLNNAAHQGLTLDRDNAGDGNCMFYALQQQLEKNGIKKTHIQIREELVKFLSENKYLGEGEEGAYLPDFVTGYSSYEEYLEYLQQDGFWGDNIVLLAAAHLYHISIWVVSSTPNSDPIIIESVNGMSQFDVHLGHICELHYVTLRPQDVLCECCGCLAEEHCCSMLPSADVAEEDATREEQSDHKSDFDYIHLKYPIDNSSANSNFNAGMIFSKERVETMHGLVGNLQHYLSSVLPVTDTSDIIGHIPLRVDHLYAGVFFHLIALLGFKVKFSSISGNLFGLLTDTFMDIFLMFRTYMANLISSQYKLVFITPFVKQWLRKLGMSSLNDWHHLMLMNDEEYSVSHLEEYYDTKDKEESES